MGRPSELEVRMAAEERFEAWRKLLPDSRLREQHRQVAVMTPIGPAILIFCLNCGRPGGAVREDCPFAFYICPSCAETHGGLPAPEIPEELMRPLTARKE